VEVEERTEEVVVIDESDSEDELDYYGFMPPDSPGLEILAWKHQGRDVELAQNEHAMPQHNRPLRHKSLSARAPLARLPEAHLAPPVAHSGQLVVAQPRPHSNVLKHRTVIDLTEDSDDLPSIPAPYQLVAAQPNSQPAR